MIPFSSRRIALFISASSILVGMVTPLGAVITSDEVGSHIVAPGQTAFGVNLDGVALIAGGVPNAQSFRELSPRCTAALISDRYLLSAAHCYDEDEDGQPDGKFTNSPQFAAFELVDRIEILRIDTNRIQIPPQFKTVQADIVVLTLEEPAPPDIRRYALHSGSDIVGRPIVISGYGDAGDGVKGTDSEYDPRATKRAGLNRYETIWNDYPFPGIDLLMYDFDSGEPEDNVMQSKLWVPSDRGFGDDEVFAARGDSGGPVFVNGAIVAVTAIGARLDNRPDESWGAIGFDVPVRTFRDFIMTATNNQAVFLLPGDFDGDENLTTGDIDLLSAAIQRPFDSKFDLNQDGTLDQADHEAWVRDYARTWFGDANLDGEFNSSDLIEVLQSGKYETSELASWNEGDWNGDERFDSSDLIVALQDGGYDMGTRAAVAVVPEPSSWILLTIGLLGIGGTREPTRRSH